MPSDLDEPYRRPYEGKTTPSSLIGSSRMSGKRRVSEDNQTGLTMEPTASFRNEAASSRLPAHHEGYTGSSSEDSTSYLSRSAVRLVKTGRPSEPDSAAVPVVDIGTGSMSRERELLVQSPDTVSPRPSTPSKLSYDRNRSTPPPSRAGTPALSTSRVHWNQLRNAIIPGASGSSVRSPVPDAGFPPSVSTAAPPRPQTPRPSRLARLGFRQVVDHTREIVQDEIGKFEAEIYQACATARFGEARAQASYLPFMSTTSLPLSVGTASQQSRSGSQSEGMGRAAPSLKLLHQTLLRHAASSGGLNTATGRLPYETEVLSVLLIPFITETGREHEERWLAVETFEIAVKGWHATSQQREIDRVLWCCKAGLIPASPVRSRVLGTLSNLLFSSSPVQDADPLMLQNIMQGMQLLLHKFNESPQLSLVDTQVVRELCVRVSSGACGKLDMKKVEDEYEAENISQDGEEALRAQVVAEGIVRCMQSGSESLRRWILHESIEVYWPLPSETWSPLCKKVAVRRLSAFLRSSLSLLRLDMMQANHQHLNSDATTIIHILQCKVLSELERLPLPRHTDDGRALVVKLLLELLSTDEHQRQQVIGLICDWSREDSTWKESLEIGIRLFVETAEWPHVTKVLQDLVSKVPNEEQRPLMPIAILALQSRLVGDPAPYPLTELTSLLQWLAELYPQQFYKPLFSLAGASRDQTVVGQLDVVTALARYLPDFWIRDAEMVSVALMSDIGGAIGKGKAKEGRPVPWAKTRIGQSLIILELIRFVKYLTKEKKDPTSPPDGSQAQGYRFVTGLEARLAILLEAKEKSALVPLSQRILLSVLFLEIRLFTRSLKPAPWLQRVVLWATQSYSGANLQSMDNPFSDQQDLPERVVGDEAYEEITSTIGKVQAIYVACWQSSSSSTRQRSTMLFSPLISPSFDPRSPTNTIDNSEAITEAIKEREELVASLSAGVASATLRLLVAACALLTEADHRILAPVLWSRFLDDTDSQIVAPACFLLTHCLEKSHKDTTKFIENDRCSPDNATKLSFIRRLTTLFAWRFQLLSQTYIYDRARRRPFKLARQPITFVAIDVGSGSYVHEQTEEDRKNLPGGTLPFELRKRLAEVGWEQDDQPTDTRLETVRAPISLFPVSQLDHLNTTREQATISPSRSAESPRQLLRRKSSAAGHQPGGKRRPVFVPALVSLFSSMAMLTIDSDPIVASAAREAILFMLRDDPVMLCRPVMDILSADLARVGSAVSVLRAFLHIHNRLPPSASHHIFSHLGGFLKHISRDSEDPGALRAFSYTVPILAKLISQVSNLSIRDLRRSKFEIYVFPSGPLWFPATAPLSPMFPRSLGRVTNPFDELPPQLVAICMIRTGQNMLLLDMLNHKPQEVHIVRKCLSGFILPGENTGKELDARSFLPQRYTAEKRRRSAYQQVSLALSRSHLLLLAQVFRSMSRNFNGRAELERLFDGLNRILLIHGDDIGIVAHALIACMTAITRFKRLVSSNRGFTLFMPSLLKVYTESDQAGIRHAIQYASSRFYAIHEESYIFQSLDLASNLLVRVEYEQDQDWFSGNIWALFSALRVPIHRGVPDAAGIHGCNRAEEREALIASTVIDEPTQAATQESQHGERLKKILATGQYEDKLLQLDDLVKLFLTVIAHDPTIVRSQNFLTLFRRMAPHFYNGSKSARDVLRDGISALSSALFAKTPRQKVYEGNPERHNGTEASSHRETEDGVGLFGNPSSPCDHVSMRREYLNLVNVFIRMGSDLRHGTLRRALELVKGLIKDSARPDPASEGVFLRDLMASFLSRLSVTPKEALDLLQDIAPIVRAFPLLIDCRGVLDAITEMLKRPELANDVTLVHFVVEHVAGPVLDACADAASENLVMSLPIRPSLVSLISHTAALGTVDVIGIIEKQHASPGFLAGIVLPLCLTIRTSAQIAVENRWQTKERAGKHSIVFVRLLAYAMDACHVKVDGENGRSSPMPTINRRDSARSKRSSVSMSRTPLARLAMIVQIIKIIVFRAADDLSNGLVGIWARLTRFLQQLLDDGNARFALPLGASPAPSPWQSPKLNPSEPHGHTPSRSPDNNALASPLNPSDIPRVVDYLAWSLMEFICCAPSPLNLQMRLWMQEKVHNLDAELKSREAPRPYIGRGSRRLSSSIFAKPRASSASPDALRASHGFSRTPSELNLSASSATDLSAYNRFPHPSPGGSLQPSWSGPQIIHLGPAKDNNMFQHIERSFSQDSHLANLARKAYIVLPSLVRMTRDRIRLVQTCMGYDRLLPLEGQSSEPGDINLKAWTRVSALGMLVEEARLIMDEFPENFHESIGDDYVDVSSQSGAFEAPLQHNSPVRKQTILF